MARGRAKGNPEHVERDEHRLMSLRTSISPALERYGIDSRQLLALVSIYLKQDLRGGRAFTQFRAREYVTANKALLIIFGSYAAMGLALGMVAFTSADVFLYSTMVLTVTVFIVALAILAEAGNALFNEAETDIIGHLPVSARTHFAAKILNLLLFTLLLAAAANLFPTLAGIWANGSSALFLVAHAVSAILSSMFATVLVVVTYGLLMRYVNKERFDNIIAYGQVVMVLCVMFGYQIFPRMMGDNSLPADSGFRWYFLLFPPAWFAGIAMLLMGKGAAGSAALACLAIISLLALGAIATQKVARGYSSFMSRLAYGPSALVGKERKKSEESGDGRRTQGLLGVIGARLLRQPVERAVFDLVLTYVRRNREIKVRLYPSLGYFIFFPLLAVLTKELADPFGAVGLSFYAFLGAAMIPFVGLTAIEGLLFSEHYHASYIFHVVPISRLADVHRGFRKAVLFSAAVPGFAALFVLYSILWRNPLHALLVLLPWVIITPVAMTVPFLFRRVLPLSRKYQKGQQSARNITLMVSSFICLSFLGVIQKITMRDYVAYVLFLGGVVVGSLILQFLLGKLSGDSRPLTPADRRSGALSSVFEPGE